MFYVVSYNDGAFELQNADAMALMPDGSYAAMEYFGGGDWRPERQWTVGEVLSVVEFTTPDLAERELLSRGGTWTTDKQGPF